MASQVDRLLLEWDVAQCSGKPLLRRFEFVNGILDADFYLPTKMKAVHYLSECKAQGKLPERSGLL